VPEDLRKELKVYFVNTVVEALKLALESDQDPEFLNQDVIPFFRAKL
jgi:hypothetical protein